MTGLEEKANFRLPNFETLGVLGRGGMATVWKARQVSLDRFVAIKVLLSQFASTENDIRQFRTEAQTAAQLKHPNIVEVYDANFSDGFYYFVMELVDGYTMGELLRRKGDMPVEDALVIAESVAVALDYAWTFHQMVHCDIKPDNIMADADGTVKVTDLGLCRTLTLIKEADEKESDEIFGTPAYMSPEQVYGDAHIDCRSDIYSLGASLYHMITGYTLFQGLDNDAMMRAHVGGVQAPDPREFAPQLKPAVVVVLERMLAKHTSLRYRDWKQVLADLKKIQDGKIVWSTQMPPLSSSVKRSSG
ncbi:MAG: serine/threonine protein kinase [Kiritimatiellaeota bacterium]|nr:serine/threonine protein kinase [Kiritimatiellota bacterium]